MWSMSLSTLPPLGPGDERRGAAARSAAGGAQERVEARAAGGAGAEPARPARAQQSVTQIPPAPRAAGVVWVLVAALCYRGGRARRLTRRSRAALSYARV